MINVPDAIAEALGERHACILRCLSLLTWAAATPRIRFKAPTATGTPALRARLVADLSSSSGDAQRAYQGAVAALSPLLGKVGVQRDVPRGGFDRRREAWTAAVACGILYQVLGGQAGILPAGGWERAHRIWDVCMVRMHAACTHMQQPRRRAECAWFRLSRKFTRRRKELVVPRLMISETSAPTSGMLRVTPG
jgi:hypothetical protein